VGRILGLDIVRAIAISLVVLTHSSSVLPESIKRIVVMVLPAIDGVSVFFVLSGFLIGGILLKIIEQKDFTSGDLLQFWIRRWFRTLPNYFLILVILLLYDIFIYRTESAFSLKYLFFVQNLTGNHPDFFPEAWSLSVEEWFYLLFPVTCFVGFVTIRTERYHVLFWVALFFLVVPFLMRIFVPLVRDDWTLLDVRKIVIYRLDSLMYGVLGAYLVRYHASFWKKIKYPCILLSALSIAGLTIYRNEGSQDWVFWNVYSFNIESVATLLALPYFSGLQQIGSTTLEKVFRFVSITSYSMYVLNLSIIQWRLVPAFLSLTHLKAIDSGHHGMIAYAVFWPFLLTGSYLLYRFYELPIMNLRDRIKLKK
jgi:peptidoglycan/LPS O-acetylase OafA/YrhL